MLNLSVYVEIISSYGSFFDPTPFRGRDFHTYFKRLSRDLKTIFPVLFLVFWVVLVGDLKI